MEEYAVDTIEFKRNLAPHSIFPDCAVCGRITENTVCTTPEIVSSIP